MKLGAITLAYQDEKIIGGTIKCLKPFVQRHLVMLSEKPYFGKETEPDRTEEICEELGVEVVKGTWALDHHQRSLGNELLKDMDWLICLDSDEMLTFKEMEKLIRFLEQTNYDAIGVQPEVYWFSTDYRLRPKPSYTPIIAMRPHVRFPHIRNIDHVYDIADVEMHHLSWCRPKDIYKKVTTYAHAPDFDGRKWYLKSFVCWEEGDKVRLPDGTYHAQYNPLPKELSEYLGLHNK